MRPKLGIHILRNPPIPKNPHSCRSCRSFLVVGVSRCVIRSFRCLKRLLFLGSRRNPRKVTQFLHIWAFSQGTLYPHSARWFKVSTVLFSQSCSESPVINRSATYCRRTPFSSCKAYKSWAKASPKRVGEFLNPCGNTVQQHCVLTSKSRSCHAKANDS